MRESEGSQTALMTAYMRAAHQVHDGDTPLLNDPIAIRLLRPEAKARLEQPIDPAMMAAARALRSYIVLRSRFTEDRLEAAVARGVRQYILVGAGFDTFALRQPAWAKDLRIFEVDHPATQAVKRQRIAEAGLDIPSNLTFADIDFEKESLLEGLVRHRVSIDEPALFSWLGVTMYLTEGAIDTTLAGMATFPVGSEVVLTFAQPRQPNSGAEAVLGAQGAQRFADIGEPWLSFFEPAAIEKKLLTAGFGSVEFLTPEAATTRYYSPGATLLPPPQITTMLAAIK